MIKIIVKYRTQKWIGGEYIYPENAEVLTFKNIDEVTNEKIKNVIDGWVEILDLKQII